MFEGLGEKLGKVFDKLKGRGVLSESDVQAAMREVRIALLEADVALPVVKEFIAQVSEKAVGEEVVKSVSPAQMVVKIVQDALTEVLGSQTHELNFKGKSPLVFLMVGLQGSGKTTSTAKLAAYLKDKCGKKPFMASLDVYRPAAQEQLATLGTQIGVETLPIVAEEKPQAITKRALKEAERGGYDILLLDTAGRLHIDEALMQEVKDVKALAKPIETLLVADALTGQDAVNIAKSFHEETEVTGIILTRIDGDSRGGAALSMKQVTGQPIKFVGVGEKVSEFEPFHPERIASRILGMGDVVSLVEKAAETVEEDEAKALEKKLRKGKFDLDDLAKQFKTMKKLGGMSGIMGMLPGLGKVKKQLEDAPIDENIFTRFEAIISSMTKQERRYPKLINGARKRRIAAGSGVEVPEVNKLLKQFAQMEKMIKKVSKMDKKSLMRGLPMKDFPR